MQEDTANQVVIPIRGELNSATVAALSTHNQRIILQNKCVVFDLSQITASDNTGVALLVTLTSFAKSNHKEVVFINVPNQLLALIAAVGLKEILPIS